MMGLATMAADLIKSRARSTLTVRRSNNLSVSSVLAANLSAGNTSLTLKGAGTSRLTGRVVSGSQFTITGITGTYTVSADADTPTSGTLPVTFTPAIPIGQSAATGAAVSFSQPYAEYASPYLRRDSLTEDEKAIEGGTQIRIIPFISGNPTPKQNDRLDGSPILKVKVVDADDGVAYYRCVIGDTPG